MSFFCTQAVVTDVAVPISQLSEIITATKHDLLESGIFGIKQFCCSLLYCVVKYTRNNGFYSTNSY